jgi:hypothetical protein
MLDNLMIHTVNIKRPTAVQGASGGETETLATVYSAQPCSIQPISTHWLVRYSTRHIDVTHTLFFNVPLTLLVGDQITYGSRTFQVQGKRDLVELGRVVVVDVLELT